MSHGIRNCPICGEPISLRAKVCAQCQRPVRGIRKWFAPVKSILELVALIASVLAIVSILQTRDQIDIQREEMRIQREGLELQRLGLRQTDSTLTLFGEQLHAQLQANATVERSREDEAVRYVEDNRPFVRIEQVNSSFDSSQLLTSIKVINSGKKTATGITVRMIWKQPLESKELAYPRSYEVGQLEAGRRWIQPIKHTILPIIVIKTTTQWQWETFHTRDSVVDYFIIEADTTKRTCEVSSLSYDRLKEFWKE